MVEIFILGCIYAHPAYRDFMMAESSDYIVILSEGHKSLFPQATCRPLTRKIYVAKNGINICLSGQICYLMCTGPLVRKGTFCEIQKNWEKSCGFDWKWLFK